MKRSCGSKNTIQTNIQTMYSYFAVTNPCEYTHDFSRIFCGSNVYLYKKPRYDARWLPQWRLHVKISDYYLERFYHMLICTQTCIWF